MALKNENARFLFKVTIAHIVTYITCGIFFSTIFNYEELWRAGVFGSHMRDYDSMIMGLGPLVQIFRGLLFGGILLLIPREFFLQKLGWLKLWAVVAGIGIVNTPGPGTGSIEGLIYTTFPLKAYVGCIEIFTQTLLFSLWVCKRDNGKGNAFFAKLGKLKMPLIAACIAVCGIMLSGILIAHTGGIDPKTGTQDPFAMLFLLLSAITAFAITAWYVARRGSRIYIFLPVCFIANGILPLAYNYATNSPFKSPLQLVTALMVTFLTWLLVRQKEKPQD
jgi:hypothetical protein